jgi:prepilin-type N-terminal cleavage/methylation domain-containing protein
MTVRSLGRSRVELQFASRKLQALRTPVSQPSTSQAFTLIELMVVIALLGILSAMIIPEMRGSYDDAVLRSTGRQFVNACNLAYSRAVSLNQVHRLRLEPSENRFVLERRAPGSGPRGNFTPVKELDGSEGSLDERISVTLRDAPPEPDAARDEGEPMDPPKEGEAGPSTPAINFYPDGTADRKVILLRDPEGFRLGLRINPVTARVRILELPRE